MKLQKNVLFILINLILSLIVKIWVKMCHPPTVNESIYNPIKMSSAEIIFPLKPIHMINLNIMIHLSILICWE